MRISHVVAGLLMVGVSGSLAGQTPPTPIRPHVMVVGLYHMDNPAQDMNNVKADDVLSEKRQKEIAELIEVLRKYKPTKIAIEVPAGSTKIQPEYEAYLAGKYTLTRNEIDQIAYRLARTLGHQKIYPIDVQGEFPFEPVAELAKNSKQEALLNDAMARGQRAVADIQASLEKGSVLDTLRYMNSPDDIAAGQMFYMTVGRIAAKDNYAGPDLLAEWYRRNMRIYANLRSIMDSPNDRVLVLYGAGHLYWLQRDVQDAGDLTLEQLKDYR